MRQTETAPDAGRPELTGFGEEPGTRGRQDEVGYRLITKTADEQVDGGPELRQDRARQALSLPAGQERVRDPPKASEHQVIFI